jgi:hypothetical protein
VSIELKITAENSADIIGQIANLAVALAGGLPKKAQVAPVPEPQAETHVEAETVEPAKKPRGRPKKAETIEHEEKAEDSTADTGDVPEFLKKDGTAQAAEAAAKAAAEEKPETAEATEKQPEQPELTLDEVRKYGLQQFVAAAKGKLERQRELYQALLKKFDVAKIGDIAPEKFADVVQAVDEMVAAEAGK